MLEDIAFAGEVPTNAKLCSVKDALGLACVAGIENVPVIPLTTGNGTVVAVADTAYDVAAVFTCGTGVYESEAGELAGDGLALAVGVSVGVADGVAVCEGEADGDGEGLGAFVPVAVAVGDIDGLALTGLDEGKGDCPAAAARSAINPVGVKVEFPLEHAAIADARTAEKR